MSAKTTTRPRQAAAPRNRTDWSRVHNMTEEEIEANAASDPDNPPQEEGLMREGRTVWPDSPRWELIQLHLNADVLEWFRARRFLYQDEINEVLRAYMDAHRDER
jgi:uncharacterized protein (DUF4415 family)